MAMRFGYIIVGAALARLVDLINPHMPLPVWWLLVCLASGIALAEYVAREPA